MSELMEVIKNALKEHGIDWILEERHSRDIDPDPFGDLLNELELALTKRGYIKK